MTDRKENKSQGPPDSSGMLEIPASTRNWLAGLLAREKDSVIWPLVPVAGDSITRGLDQRGTIAVRVQAGRNHDTGEPVVYPATLARQVGTTGGFEFTLAFNERPAGDLHPYALTVGKLDLWSFEPLSLGKLAEPTVELAEQGLDAAEVQAAEQMYGLGASPPVGEILHASHQRLDLHWSDGLLEIRLAQPPRHRGQPVVVETTVRDVWGDLHTVRDVVSVEDRITDGEFAGYLLGTLSRPEPLHVELDRLRVTVRSLRADDLPLLSPRQIDSLLAGQQLKVLTTRAEGFELRTAAVWDDQQQAVSAPDSTWLVRVATGKEVR